MLKSCLQGNEAESPAKPSQCLLPRLAGSSCVQLALEAHVSAIQGGPAVGSSTTIISMTFIHGGLQKAPLKF